MRTAMLVPLACLSLHAGDPWADAQAAFRKEVQPGFTGCLIHVQRLNATSLRLRVQSKDLRLGFLEGEPMGQPAGQAGYGFKVSAPRWTSDLSLITVVPEGSTAFRLRIDGDEVRSEVVVHLPKPGESEKVVLQFAAPQGGISGSSKSK